MRTAAHILFMIFAISLAVTGSAKAQGTAVSEFIAESDTNWSGTYLDRLPSCDGEGMCLALLTHGDRGDEYYHGVIQNNTQNWVFVHDVTVELFDEEGEFAAQGDTFDISPRVVSPGGHALIGLTVAGEYISEFTTEATIDFEPGTEGQDGFGVSVSIESADIRGTAILGEMINTSPFTFNHLHLNVACFADDGSISFTTGDMASNGPYDSGASERFALELYGHNCDNFVVNAYGNPY